MRLQPSSTELWEYVLNERANKDFPGGKPQALNKLKSSPIQGHGTLGPSIVSMHTYTHTCKQWEGTQCLSPVALCGFVAQDGTFPPQTLTPAVPQDLCIAFSALPFVSFSLAGFSTSSCPFGDTG